jgi:Cys-tRNA(Pro) deacylase
MGKSTDRVRQAAQQAGLQIEIVTLPESTRTAAQAAQAVGCAPGQIVKSLIFEGAQTGALVLVLVSGARELDLSAAAASFGEALVRADPKRVREQTGFAIGGVAPIGHLCAMPVFMDTDLLQYATVWAAGGAPDAVFRVAPHDLRAATQAVLLRY